MILYDSGRSEVASADPHEHTRRLLPNARGAAADNPRQFAEVILIHPKPLIADCILHSLSSFGFDNRILAFQSVNQWLSETAEYQSPASTAASRDMCDHNLILIYATDKDFPGCKGDLDEIFAAVGQSASVILLCENTEYIHDALEAGIRGFIPESLPLKVAAQAIDLVLAGGTFVPSAALFRNKASDVVKLSAPSFTGREAEVLGGLVRGASNKIIAYELGMSECTVKIHVRNILRKLKARNRTHVGFIVHEQHLDIECRPNRMPAKRENA
jgi:DNA-binding NarL/FixJ family response regulator